MAPVFPAKHAKWLPSRPTVIELNRWLDGDESVARVVKQTENRTIYALSPTPGGEPTYFVKHDHPSSAREITRTLIVPNVSREYKNGRKLFAAGVPTPEPVACAWRLTQGLLMTRAIPAAQAASSYWTACRENPTRREEFLRAMANFMKRLVHLKLDHPDLHMDNIMASTGQGGATEFYLIDLYGARQKSVLVETDLHRLFLWLHLLREDMADAEVQQFLEASGVPEPATFAAGLRYTLVDESQDHWQARRPKLLRDSSFVDKEQDDDGIWFSRRDFDLAVGRAVISWWQAGDPSRDRQRGVFRERLVEHEDKRYTVRAWLPTLSEQMKLPDREAWLAYWRAEMLNLPVPRILGWYRNAADQGWLLTEPAAGISLTELLAGETETGEERAREIMRQLHLILDACSACRLGCPPDIGSLIALADDSPGATALCLATPEELQFTGRHDPSEWRVQAERLLPREGIWRDAYLATS